MKYLLTFIVITGTGGFVEIPQDQLYKHQKQQKKASKSKRSRPKQTRPSNQLELIAEQDKKIIEILGRQERNLIVKRQERENYGP